MKHFIINSVFLVAFLFPFKSFARVVCETNADGKTLYYILISGSECEVYQSSSYKDFRGELNIPKTACNHTVIGIRSDVFANCSGLTSVTIPNSVTSIGNSAFSGCSGLTSVTIPNSVNSIGSFAFSGCRGLMSIVVEDGNTVFDSRNNCNAIIKTATNTLILGSKNTIIPNNIESIGNGAFSGCSELISIEIPNSVTNIGFQAFSGCTNLSSFTIPKNVSTIGYSAFSGCDLNTLTIDDGADNLLFDTSSNTTPFDNCYIRSLYLGRYLSYTNNYSPFKDTLLSSLTLGNGITCIEESAFSGCSYLSSITFGNNLTNIGKNAFSGCSNLISLFIPNTVTSIESGAFNGCNGLSSLTISNRLSYIASSVFGDCSGLTSITIPNSVTTIGSNAFSGCTCLTTVSIPNSVTTIEDNAFEGCSSLTSVSIPSSITTIGNNAFSGCNNLATVYSKIIDVFEINANVFSECENATLYVPKDLVVTYRTTEGWNVFKFIEEMKSNIEIEDFSFLLSCNSKGSITVNGKTEFTNKIGSADILEDSENTFVFTPKTNCKLEQVCLNGFDITLSVENNTLKAVIPAKSQMVVTFANESGDMNNDGIINISDVVLLVNMILGQ